MTALGLHRLVPASLLAGRWIVVLVCYLDDSGKDRENPITTIAGYVAREDAWQAFEAEVNPICDSKGVQVLHAMELHRTESYFEGWTILQKQAFIARLGQVASRHLMMGLSMSALKGSYQDHARHRASGEKPRQTVTPYAFCFEAIIDWLLTDIRIGRAVNTEGVAVILECGHENNGQAEKEFYWIQEKHKLHNVLRSISFVPKTACRAIQYADLLAYYSRRDGVKILNAQKSGNESYERDMMLKIISENVPHRAFVATGFHDRPHDEKLGRPRPSKTRPRPVPRPR